MDAALQALKTRLGEIETARQERLKAGEVISSVEVVNPLRTNADWDLLWPIVRVLRRDHPTVAVKFPENTLAATIVDCVREDGGETTLAALAQTLTSWPPAKVRGWFLLPSRILNSQNPLST